MAKKVNNPDGKNGGEKHKNRKDAEEKKLQTEFLNNPEVTVGQEVPVFTPNGKKKIRFADVAAFLSFKPFSFLRIVQIGRAKADGTPVKTQQEAIDDIEAHTEIKVTFVDYDKD